MRQYHVLQNPIILSSWRLKVNSIWLLQVEIISPQFLLAKKSRRKSMKPPSRWIYMMWSSPRFNLKWNLWKTMKKHTCEGCHIVPMYGIFTYMYHKFRSNVGKDSIHGAYGMCNFQSLNGHLWGRPTQPICRSDCQELTSMPSYRL